MEIRRVDHNTYDLFQGKGWDNFTRIRKGRSSTFGVLGQRVPHAMLKDLHDILHPQFPINYGQTLGETLDNLAAIRGN